MSAWQPIETAPKAGEFMLWIADLPWPGYRNYNGDIYSRAHGLVNKPDPTRVTRASHWAPMLEPPK